MADKWRRGEPPKDERSYEVKQRYRFAGHWHTAQWQDRVFWNGEIFVRISQLDGKPRGVVLINRWRRAAPFTCSARRRIACRR